VGPAADGIFGARKALLRERYEALIADDAEDRPTRSRTRSLIPTSAASSAPMSRSTAVATSSTSVDSDDSTRAAIGLVMTARAGESCGLSRSRKGWCAIS
jgi:hypothetical protein